MGIGIPLWFSLHFLMTDAAGHLVVYSLPSIDFIWWSVFSNLRTFNLLFPYYWVLWDFLFWIQVYQVSTNAVLGISGLILHYFNSVCLCQLYFQANQTKQKSSIPRRSGVISVDKFYKLFILLCIMLSVSNFFCLLDVKVEVTNLRPFRFTNKDV